MKNLAEVREEKKNEYRKNLRSKNLAFDSLDFDAGFEAATEEWRKVVEGLLKALKFYTLKSNYSIVDEGRDYRVDYKCYELNEETYSDDELGTVARKALEDYQKKVKL